MFFDLCELVVYISKLLFSTIEFFLFLGDFLFYLCQFRLKFRTLLFQPFFVLSIFIFECCNLSLQIILLCFQISQHGRKTFQASFCFLYFCFEGLQLILSTLFDVVSIVSCFINSSRLYWREEMELPFKSKANLEISGPFSQ